MTYKDCWKSFLAGGGRGRTHAARVHLQGWAAMGGTASCPSSDFKFELRPEKAGDLLPGRGRGVYEEDTPS